jgi:hypothetical protein
MGVKMNLNKIYLAIKNEIAREQSIVRQFFARLSAVTKKVIFTMLTIYLIGSGAAIWFSSNLLKEHEKTKADLQVAQAKESEDQRVGNYIMFIMSMRNLQISEFQKQLMAQAIVRVSGNVFATFEERTWFVILINNESGFDKNAKSLSGAVGLTQVMPQFVEEFGNHCNITNVNPSEASDMEINLTLGACRFKHLLQNYNGVYSTALAAYNGGKNAKSVKELQRLANVSTEETAQYIIRFTHVKATADANERSHQTYAPTVFNKPDTQNLSEPTMIQTIKKFISQ